MLRFTSAISSVRGTNTMGCGQEDLSLYPSSNIDLAFWTSFTYFATLGFIFLIFKKAITATSQSHCAYLMKRHICFIYVTSRKKKQKFVSRFYVKNDTFVGHPWVSWKHYKFNIKNNMQHLKLLRSRCWKLICCFVSQLLSLLYVLF